MRRVKEEQEDKAFRAASLCVAVGADMREQSRIEASERHRPFVLSAPGDASPEKTVTLTSTSPFGLADCRLVQRFPLLRVSEVGR